MLHRLKKRVNGYTLVELITVSSLSVLLLSLSVTAFYRMKKPADIDNATAIFRAAASQARSSAVTKLYPCRVIVEHAPRGDKLSVERRTNTTPYKWIKMSATNTLSNTSVLYASSKSEDDISKIPTSGTAAIVFFRTDGSCCIDEKSIDLSDEEDSVLIDFISSTSSKNESGRIRTVKIDMHSGLSSLFERSYENGR